MGVTFGCGLASVRERDIGGSYRCAPSERAINGSRDQSFSTAGSVPSSAMQYSISGPLQMSQSVGFIVGLPVLVSSIKFHLYGVRGIKCSVAYRAWWKSITNTIGSCLWTAMAPGHGRGNLGRKGSFRRLKSDSLKRGTGARLY